MKCNVRETDRRTDVKKLILAFRTSAKARATAVEATAASGLRSKVVVMVVVVVVVVAAAVVVVIATSQHQKHQTQQQ